MKIGILSDTHNNSKNARRALAIMHEHNVDHLVHCGDLTTPEMITLFDGWTVSFVYGNMDRHKDSLVEAVKKLGQGEIAISHSLKLGEKRIGICHGHQKLVLRNLIHGAHDYVFHGHTHRRRDEHKSQTRVINPGALGGTRHEARSVCVVDLQTDEVTFIKL